MSEKPKVSVCCMAYNHGNYIRQTLDSFLMQKTNFPFEILVHDDASQDNTAEIIREYEANYPDKIKAVCQTQNLYLQEKTGDRLFLFPMVQGKYVAICEGDDYWTDENKLQKQADFLDSHPDYTVCFHGVKKIFEDGSQPEIVYPTEEMMKGRTTLTFLDELQFNYIQTNSVMYRWIFDRENNKAEEKIPEKIMPSDWFLHLMHAYKGKIGYLPEVMAVYRKHPAGLFADYNEAPDIILSCCGVAHLNFYIELEKMFPEYLKYGGRKNTLACAFKVFSSFAKNSDFKQMQKVLQLCPDFLEYMSGIGK